MAQPLLRIPEQEVQCEVRPAISRFLAIALTALLLLASGCARSPEAQKARRLERGDRYTRAERYREAVLEYRNVLRLEPDHARALRRLGFAHFQLGEMGQAFRALLRAQALEPENPEVRIKLGTIYLVGGRAQEARAQAEAALEQEPRSLEALLLWSAAATTRDEIEAALGRLEGMGSDFGGLAKYHLTPGSLHLRRQDARRATGPFREAVAREPRSVEAQVARGHVLLTQSDVAGAERAFTAAAELAPAGSAGRKSRAFS